VSAADVIQLVIAAGTLAAALAAWRAANASRDSVREADKARRASVLERQIGMLSELLGLVASLVVSANIVSGQGERYGVGARIRNLMLALPDYDLPECAQIGKILGGGQFDVPGPTVVKAEREVSAAILSERRKLAELTGSPGSASAAGRTRWTSILRRHGT
jgi:hypothetical protein